MKKIIIILSIILICILFIGFNFINKSSYNQNQIEEINNVIKSNMKNITSINTENIDENIDEISENAKDEETNDKPPKIDIVYPSNFDDGDTIETKRVQLVLSDDSKVVKATMNEIPVDTKEIYITTEGTYNISVIDDNDNETTLSFTIIFPKKTTSKKTSNSSSSDSNSSEKNEEPSNGDGATGDGATGDDATGDDITGDDITGDDATGDDITGDDITGDDTTGDDTTGDDTTGD